MGREDLLKQINSIFIEVLDNPDIVLTEGTNADDVEEWDSLNHIQLVVEVEKTFSLRFTALEIQSWNTVGEMIDSILAKKQ
ncbi:MAG: acyl carrier protein [Chitinophagaceae bacterium]|nr:acyl carrier protein [Chitinophagaceae bacterium]